MTNATPTSQTVGYPILHSFDCGNLIYDTTPTTESNANSYQTHNQWHD